MRFISTSIISADALGQLASRKQPIGFDDVAFAMNPFRFDRVEPGAFGGQKAGQDANAFARVLDLEVVLSDEGSYHFGDVPGSVIPDEEPMTQAFLGQPVTTPVQELDRDGGNRATRDKSEPQVISHRRSGAAFLPQHPITSQGLGVRVIFLPDLLDQTNRVIPILPGVQGGQSKSGPPDLIEKANRPIPTGSGVGDEAITSRFFWRYSGSGLLIQCLARFQLTPNRARARRTLAPVVRTGVTPCETATWAARSKDHTPRSMPNSRGLRCKSSRKAGSFSSGMVVRSRWGRQEAFLSTARPWWLKPLMTLRTVWSSQPNCSAMAVARSPRAEANSIWQRRKTKADDECNPAWMCLYSVSLKGRMKMGFIPSHIGTFPTFFRRVALGRLMEGLFQKSCATRCEM